MGRSVCHRHRRQPLIYFLTVHFGSDRWIDIQLRNIARHTKSPFEVWGCLNDVPGSHESKFARTFDLTGSHGEKLNELAGIVGEVCRPDDHLAFIDGDAFPIADWDERVLRMLETEPLVAVRRDENFGDRQPHPCFAMTTAAFWRDIEGDWSFRGPSSFSEHSTALRGDVGSRVLERLEERGLSWHPLLRSNRTDLHPLLFGVYGDLVYHHGAGFRRTMTSVDRARIGLYKPPPKSRLGAALDRSVVHQAIRRHRSERTMRRNHEMSERVFEAIRQDDGYIARSFLSAT